MNKAMHNHIEALKTKAAAGCKMTSLQTKILNRAKAGPVPVMSIKTSFVCSSCKSRVVQRIIKDHWTAFRAKVKNSTVLCYSCKMHQEENNHKNNI